MTAETITREEIERLRHQLNRGGFTPLPLKVRALLDMAEAHLDEPDRLSAARAEGVREGMKKAAQWHDTEVAKFEALAIDEPDWMRQTYLACAGEHRRYAETLRSLSPALADAPTTPTVASDGWIAWEGGECPVPAETLVEVRLRDGEVSTGRGREWTWEHGVEPVMWWDIIAYRIVQPAEASAPVAEGE